MSAAYIYAAVRSPFGRYGGALADVRNRDVARIAVLLAGLPLCWKRDRMQSRMS